jgi:hypothetical protein
MHMSLRARRIAAAVTALALITPTAASAAIGGLGGTQIVKNAACKSNDGGNEKGEADRDAKTVVDCDNEGELAGFVDAADALVSPAVIAMAAITPIACLVGAGSVMFGSRRGLVIIGAALGTLVFVVSIKGIVA